MDSNSLIPIHSTVTDGLSIPVSEKTEDIPDNENDSSGAAPTYTTTRLDISFFLLDIEIEAAEALLDIGVSLPFFKIPFTRKVVRLTMRRPCLGGQIRLARLYLQTGITYERMLEFTKHEELAYMALHGRRVSKMVALTICRGAFSTWLFSGLLAWLLRWFVDDEYLRAANMQFLRLLGTKSFMSIIRSISTANPMRPRLSRERRKKGS